MLLYNQICPLIRVRKALQASLKIVLFGLLCGLNALTVAQVGNVVTINPPRPDRDVTPMGINNLGEVFGSFTDGDRAFKFNNGIFTIIAPPGAVHTEPTAMNNSGEVVGYFSDSTGVVRGFRYRNGTFNFIAAPAPGHSPHPERITDTGEIYGIYFLDPVGQYLFRVRNGAFTTLTPDGARFVRMGGITSSGVLWGGWISHVSGIDFPFLHRDGEFSFFSGPFEDEWIVDINDADVLLGSYIDHGFVNNGDRRRGFILKDGNYIPIFIFGEDVGFVPMGINNAGEVYGTFGGGIGFKYYTVDHTFDLIEPPGGGKITMSGINEAGAIYGTYFDSNNLERAFKFSAGNFTTINGPNAKRTIATGMNNSGEIVGYFYDANDRVFGFKYSNGSVVTITGPGSTNTQALGINDAGEVYGTYINVDGRRRGFKFPIVGDPKLPQITNVTRTYAGVFLRGLNENNNFDVKVDWKGTPGRVRFQVNNNAPFDVQGNASGVIQSFNLATSFPASTSPSQIRITPINGEGQLGETRTEEIYIFPYPSWLEIAIGSDTSALNITTHAGEVRYNFNIEFPQPPFKALVPIPTNVPVIGGQFGVRETKGVFKGFASSMGTGSLTLSGQTGIVGMGQEVTGRVSGEGSFLLNQSGLSIPDASFNFGVTGTFSKESTLLDAIPLLSSLNRFPAIKRFNEVSKLRGELEVAADASLRWKQDPATGHLVLNSGTAQVGGKMKGVLKTQVRDRITFKGWIAGGGVLMVGAPSPFVRSFDFAFEAGAQFKIDHLLGGTCFELSYARRCTWIPSTGEVSCSTVNDESCEPAIKSLQQDYGKFGAYESFNAIASASKIAAASMSIATTESTIVANVYPGAQPAILPVGDENKVLLWVRQNPNLPTLQSTDLAWSFFDGTKWSAPAAVVNDSRAEFSPVAGVDAQGNVVASWLRIKDPAFTTPVATIDDLRLFYKNVEVVSATFNPSTKTWSSVTALTDDLSLDTALRLASDTGGDLMLTWQSNPDGAFTATENAPATLKYSVWNGSSWTTPQPIAENLTNIGDHAVALRGRNAFLVLPRDVDPNTANDQVLLSYSWNGTSWTTATVFADGTMDNQLPAAAYDATGREQVIWRRGPDLVQASLSSPTPRLVRQGSDSAAFNNIRLLNNPQGNLTLLWQEIANNGPAGIFAQIYDSRFQTWSSDRLLHADQRMSADVNGFYGADGKLHLAYLSTEVLRTSRTVVINGQQVTITDVPVDGATDLRLLDLALITDLAVSDLDLSLSPQLPATGQAATAQLDIRNVGEFAANGFQVSLYAGDPDNGGMLIGSVRVTVPLAAGDHRVIPIPFTNLTGGELIAVVDALQEISEFSEVNNRARIQLPGLSQSVTISGRVTLGTTGLSGVVMSLTSPSSSGSASGTVTTSATGTYSFTNLPTGRNYIITPAKTNYRFSPLNKSYSNLTANQNEQNFAATGIPILISEENSTRALAFDAVTHQREPFQRFSSYQWGTDRGTRVMLFAMNADLLMGEDPSVIRVTGEDALHTNWSMPVEYVGKVPGLDWLTCVIVNVGFVSPDRGDVLVRLEVRGIRSNRVRLGLGHIGGGLPDDPGSLPTPGRQP